MLLTRRDMLAAAASFAALRDCAGDPPQQRRAAGQALPGDWGPGIAGDATVRIPAGRHRTARGLDLSRSGLRLAARGVLEPAGADVTLARCVGTAPTTFAPLRADAAAGATAFVSAARFAPGTWVELRSDALLGGAEARARRLNRTGLLAKVVRCEGGGPFRHVLDTALPYDFRIRDGARVGAPVMRENIVIEDLALNGDDFRQAAKVGLALRYCANVTIVRPRIYGTKARNAIEDEHGDAGRNGISLFNCVNVRIIEPVLAHLAWYGIGINGACRDIAIQGGTATDVRHAVSIVHVQEGFGEPLGVRTTGLTARATTKSCFDTHELGRHIEWIDCWGRGSIADSAFNVRSPGVLIRGGGGVNCRLDGIIARTDARDTRVENFVAEGNGRSGINLATGGGTITGARAERNGRIGGPRGGAQLVLSHGAVSRTRIVAPLGYAPPVRIEGDARARAAAPLPQPGLSGVVDAWSWRG
jgi:hypothetical protein